MYVRVAYIDIIYERVKSLREIKNGLKNNFKKMRYNTV